jgi:multidrug efflux pump subunit AcrB
MTRRTSTLAVLSVLAATLLGVILSRTIPSAVFPEITFRRATILADSGDLPAEQMLAAVTRPLEEAAYSVPGVTLVRSTTTRGSAEIDVTFGEDADPQTSYQMLNAALSHGAANHRHVSDSRYQHELEDSQPAGTHRYRELRPRTEPASNRRHLQS